jgi:PAS domain S-box-containing protein
MNTRDNEFLKPNADYYSLFEFSPLPMVVYNIKDLRFLAVNIAAVGHYGFSEEEFLSMSIKDILPDKELILLERLIEENYLYRQSNTGIYNHIKKNGSVITVNTESNLINFEGHDARLVLITDITEKLRSEQILKENAERYDIVSKATSDTIWDMSLRNNIIVWNKGIKGIFKHKDIGYTTSIDWWHSKIHPEDRARVLGKIEIHIKEGITRWQDEYRFACGDGTYKYVFDRGFLALDTLGTPYRMIGAMQDITESRSYIKAIEEQNAKLKEIGWMQSHTVRAPLARIMGLVDLLHRCAPGDQDYKALLDHLSSSAEELDRIIIDIAKSTEDFNDDIN